MKQEITNIIKSLPNLSKAYLFGSRAKGNSKEDSDYDICIVITDTNKDIVYKLITEYYLTSKNFIQPLVLTINEFEEKMKIEVYRVEILVNGKLIT